MGKSKKSKKSKNSTLILATTAYDKIMKMKTKAGEHILDTTVGEVKAVSKIVTHHERGDEARATFYFRGVRIPKMALKTLLDSAGRFAGEEPTTRKVPHTVAFKKWALAHPDTVSKFTGVENLKPVEKLDKPFKNKQLAVVVKKKALKKHLEGFAAMLDKDGVGDLIAAAFVGTKKTTIGNIIAQMPDDTPATDIKDMLSGLL